MLKEIPTKTVADRIIVEPIEVKEVAGMVMPSDTNKPQRGIIKVKGPETAVCKEGDQVLFAKGAGVKVMIGTSVYFFMRECDIFCVL